MAFQQSVTKSVPFQSTPLVYPNAYWVATFDRLDKVAKVAIVRFLAFADKATREVGNVQPVDSHSFNITGADFDTYFSTASASSPDVYAQAYVMAKATADPILAQQRIARAQGTVFPPVVFFANATEV
jgi:hypothetical protein